MIKFQFFKSFCPYMYVRILGDRAVIFVFRLNKVNNSSFKKLTLKILIRYVAEAR